jgi:hypothetical protein
MITYKEKSKAIENEKGKIEESDLDYRSGITKVRGGWTKEKIKKELKNKSSTDSQVAFHKEIAKYNTLEDFSENLFYHGSSRPVYDLKPSIILKSVDHFGGGEDRKYFGISLSRSRDIASNFTGVANHGNVAPVLIKRGSVIKKMPEIQDACELDDIIIDLWTDGVDAVIIGDHIDGNSEKEVVILNPKCISIGPRDGFMVYQKPKMHSFSPDKLEELWSNSSSTYKILAIESQEKANEAFKAKHGRERSTGDVKLSNRQNNLIGFHEHNVFLHEKSKKENIRDFIKDKKASQKTKKIIKNIIN